MTTQPTISASSPAAPAEALQCPLCDYDLRGLVEPRCPECGYAFDWADLRDPARRKHKYLFEHHPERNVRSFARTMIGHLRPRKFWGGLLPSQPSHPRRLFIYALVIAISATFPPAALMTHMMQNEWSQMAANRRSVAASMAWPANLTAYQRAMKDATARQILDQYAPAPTVGSVLGNVWRRSIFHRSLLAHAISLLWPALSFAALMIFQISMRRARVRPVHFARLTVYAADVILWANLLLAALVVGFTLRQILIGGTTPLPAALEAYGVAATCICLAALLLFVYRLIVALAKYVHFDHPVATIFMSQFIVFLLMLILLTLPMQLGYD